MDGNSVEKMAAAVAVPRRNDIQPGERFLPTPRGSSWVACSHMVALETIESAGDHDLFAFTWQAETCSI